MESPDVVSLSTLPDASALLTESEIVLVFVADPSAEPVPLPDAPVPPCSECPPIDVTPSSLPHAQLTKTA
ncbi:MAG: hypothetical protein IPH07_11215 [Deltaproteobacteria bacterium]|nr:hypothetical protein [Deltaproteobacteria bacterium]MBK8237314.1 hypothetical protein [Deltaproteobacteria bacterium]MBP7285438.1 hypothetical protein [Nannocystaceae bacterium]